VKVRIERDLCIGVGNGAAYAPMLFKLNEESKAVVLDPDSVDDDTLLEVAKSCPESAIMFEDNK